MKIDRLIGILAILLQQERVTAPFLAEKFEVSRRTINRDIEDLCKAGIPLVTTQGQNGGIAIMEGYSMDKTLLTSSDMQTILAGIRSLDSVSGTSRYQQLMDKLALGNSQILASNHDIVIDLSSWYKTSLAPKIELIQSAISRKEWLEFDYYGPGGEGRRTIEPYTLLFKWSSWYLWGYCRERSDYRLFKLNRMLDLKMTGQLFEARMLPEMNLNADRIFPENIEAVAVFDPCVKWRLIDEYGVDSFSEREDGMLVFRSGFMEKESLFGWLLGFGTSVELVEPLALREEFSAVVGNIMKKY